MRNLTDTEINLIIESTINFKKNKIIKEQSTGSDFIDGLSSSLVTSVKTTIVEYLLDAIEENVGSLNKELRDLLESGLMALDWTEDWKKILEPKKNCQYFAGVFADAIIRYLLMKVGDLVNKEHELINKYVTQVLARLLSNDSDSYKRLRGNLAVQICTKIDFSKFNVNIFDLLK